MTQMLCCTKSPRYSWLIAYGLWRMVPTICHKLSAICEVRARLASEIFLSSLQTEFLSKLLANREGLHG